MKILTDSDTQLFENNMQRYEHAQRAGIYFSSPTNTKYGIWLIYHQAQYLFVRSDGGGVQETTSDSRVYTWPNFDFDGNPSSTIVRGCSRSGADFTIYTLGSLWGPITTKTITLTSGYSIQKYVFFVKKLDSDEFYGIAYGASNGSQHYYGIAQITTTGVTSLYTSSVYSGGTCNAIPAPCLDYPVDAWIHYVYLCENNTHKYFSVNLKSTSPSATLINTITLTASGTYVPTDTSTLLRYRHDYYYITLKKTADNTYHHFRLDPITSTAEIIHTGQILYPTQELLISVQELITYDLSRSTICIVTDRYPGTLAYSKQSSLFDNLIGWNYRTLYYQGDSTGVYGKIVTPTAIIVASGSLDSDKARLVLPTKIDTFPDMHLLLYDDSSTLIARLLVLDEQYYAGMLTLICQNLSAEINELYRAQNYGSNSTAYILTDQLRNARYIYPGIAEGNISNFIIRDGYSVASVLIDLALILDGIGYVTPAGSVEFRTATFETGPTLNRGNANLMPESYAETMANYGTVRVYGGFYQGAQQISEAVDSRADQSLVYSVDIPSVVDESHLSSIAANILAWQQDGIVSVKLRYLFGYLHRGKKCTVNLSGWGVRFGQSEPLTDLDMYVLSYTHDLRSGQSEVELATIPQLVRKGRIGAEIRQQQHNIQRQVGYSAFSAYLNASVALTEGINAKISYPYKEYDLAEEYDTTTGRFTAKRKGIYHFDASMLTNNYAWTAGDIFFLILYKNGSIYQRGYRHVIEANITNYFHGIISADILLNAGDYVELGYNLNKTGRWTFPSLLYNRFSGHLVTTLD